MNTNMTGFRWFSKILVFLQKSNLSIGMVNPLKPAAQHRKAQEIRQNLCEENIFLKLFEGKMQIRTKPLQTCSTQKGPIVQENLSEENVFVKLFEGKMLIRT